MRHKISGAKLNRTSPHRKSMLANMAVSLIIHEQIHTTIPKAKALRPYVEKLVTLAKDNTLSSRKRVISKIADKQAVQKLFSILNSRYTLRQGGYTRVIKTENRYGDNAPMAFIEFIEKDLSAKGTKMISL
jgi:large subunit ribosomal protein L17